MYHSDLKKADERRTVAPKSRKYARPKIASKKGNPKKKVLVVEDNDAVRDLFMTVLKDGGYDVRAVASAADAFQTLKKFKPDVIMTGIEMPGDDGYVFLKKLRQLKTEECGRAPVIAVTAKIESEAHFRDAGFQAYLCKPTTLEKLLSTVADCAKTSA